MDILHKRYKTPWSWIILERIELILLRFEQVTFSFTHGEVNQPIDLLTYIHVRRRYFCPHRVSARPAKVD